MRSAVLRSTPLHNTTHICRAPNTRTSEYQPLHLILRQEKDQNQRETGSESYNDNVGESTSLHKTQILIKHNKSH